MPLRRGNILITPGHHPPTPAVPTDGDGLIRLLHERGQRVTPQRLVILRQLQRGGRHATADEIGRAVRDELPGTSTPTVYATLELLVELGLARRIDAGAGAALYDPRTEPHPHTVCHRCGRIDDLDAALDVDGVRRAAAASGFAPAAVEVVVSGVCAGCAAAPPPDVSAPPAGAGRGTGDQRRP